MAVYEYRCDPCGAHFDQRHPMGAAPSGTDCPTCGGGARRAYRPPAAIHFHGSGFYSTDVTSKIARRRRPNPGDDLHKEFDIDAAKIAAAI